jgi:hypothetical protein
MYKEINNLLRHFLVEETWLGCSEKKPNLPTVWKNWNPMTRAPNGNKESKRSIDGSALQLGKGGTGA